MNDVEHNNLLLENCIKSNEKMSHTMDEIKDTLVVLVESVNQNNKIVNELAINVRALNNKIYKNKNNIFDSLRRTYNYLFINN